MGKGVGTEGPVVRLEVSPKQTETKKKNKTLALVIRLTGQLPPSSNPKSVSRARWPHC